MTIRMEIYKCGICGNIVEVNHAGAGELMCCGKKMILLEASGDDKGKEKHIPVLLESGDNYVIQIGEIEHPMSAEHHIEWIEVATNEEILKKYTAIGERPVFEIGKRHTIKTVRSYCNIHGLWKKLNLDDFNREDLILFAIKAETDSENVYKTLAGRVKNAFLKERMNFLAGEEIKHKDYFEELYKKTYLKNEIILPKDGVVPLPKIDLGNEKTPISEILLSAMSAESAAHEFYMELSVIFSDMPKTANMLKFFASMEMVHYTILSMEKKNADIFESYENEIPMIHVGP